MKTTAELREGFLSYFESKGHLRLPSGSLIPPPDDTSTLFTIAGMQPLRNYFLGAKPPGPRATTAQKVMRAGGKHNDLDDVGTTERHASFFEMLGNFSFGDYFKQGAIELAWEFTLEHLRFPEERVWATVFAGDPELGLGEDEDGGRGLALGRDAARADHGAAALGELLAGGRDRARAGRTASSTSTAARSSAAAAPECAPGCECERFLEFWNLVFMEFDLGADGLVTPLPKQNVDTGMGLERAAMLLQGVDSIFEVDNVRALITLGRGAQRQALRRVGARHEGVPRDRRPRPRRDLPARRRRRCPRTRAAATCCAA